MPHVALFTTVGVMIRADTRHGVHIGLIELAANRGWVSDYYENGALATAGRASDAPAPEAEQQLIRGAEEALAWLTTYAVPAGHELVELDDRIVLRPKGNRLAPEICPQSRTGGRPAVAQGRP